MISSSLMKRKIPLLLFKFPNRNITVQKINESSQERTYSGRGMDVPAKKETAKEYEDAYVFTHPHHVNFVTKIVLWINTPYKLRIWNTDKDVEMNKYEWNCNGKHGAHKNTLSNILFRSKKLQTESMMRFFMRWFPYRHTVEQNVAEEPPKITPNSVFVYLDKSNVLTNKLYVEKFFALMFMVHALNIYSLLLYTSVGYFLGLYTKVKVLAGSTVVRMDVLPEIEKIHIVKVGNFGRFYGQIVDPKDLVLISQEEVAKPERFWVSRLWNPQEDQKLIYRHLKTKEEYTFIKNGIWNEEGVNHKLLNN